MALHCEIKRIPVDGGFTRVFVICMSSSSSQYNLIDRSFALELGTAVYTAQGLAAAGDIDLLVLCSAKEKSFIAGADIKLELQYIGPRGALSSYQEAIQFNYILCALETLPIPTVAVLNGTTLGGGLEIALSCDYRVTDIRHCKQLGLPEVKIGVLPGAAGCVRLPALIGLRSSLPLLLTGASVTSKRAVSLGISDMEWTSTQSTLSEGCYDYEWVDELVQCINIRAIGRKRLTVNVRGMSSEPPVVAVVMPHLTEDALAEKLSVSWPACEKKSLEKYGSRASVCPSLSTPVGYAKDWLIYAVSAYQLWKRVGHVMPAPYHVLRTAWLCHNTPSWYDAIVTNATGFSKLVETAESKGLMWLFLVARQLGKEAIESARGSNSENGNRSKPEVVIFVDSKGVWYSSGLVQALIYVDISVRVVVMEDNGIISDSMKSAVTRLFTYAVRKGYITKNEAKQKIADKLSFVMGVAELDRKVGGRVYINMATEKDLVQDVNNLEEAIQRSDVVFVNGVPCKDECGGLIPVHFGDTVRKNTMSIEFGYNKEEVTSDRDVSLLTTVISLMGKTPIVTPRLSNVGWTLALSHWNFLSRLHHAGVSKGTIEQCLKCAGFTKGGFETMEQFNKTTLQDIVAGSEPPDVEYLAKYLSRQSKNVTTPITPHLSKLSQLIVMNIVCTGGQLLRDHSHVSPDAIEFMAVSGLVHFPPSEGGPLSYWKRNGCDTLLDLSPTGLAGIAREVECKVKEISRVLDEAHLSLLSNEQLKLIGPCRGLMYPESLFHPLPFDYKLLLCLVLLVLIFWNNFLAVFSIIIATGIVLLVIKIL